MQRSVYHACLSTLHLLRALQPAVLSTVLVAGPQWATAQEPAAVGRASCQSATSSQVRL
jgi:hypothetical protein